MGDTMKDDFLSSSSSLSLTEVRRYSCNFCGISRSKRYLIKSHILASHQDEPGFTEYALEEERKNGKREEYDCTECGASFKKPAYLRQHMQSHSLERSFVCPVEDCHQSYRRKDHLSRHMLLHEGKVFACSVNRCGRQFTLKSNIRRHVKDFHDNDDHSEDDDCASAGQSQSPSPHQYLCQEPGCGMGFRYHSRLRKHQESHVQYVDVICGEPGCMKHFTNAECLRAHVQSCHLRIECTICGTQQLRKNIKRHLRSHERETQATPDKINCPFPRCLHSFSRKSNLDKHINAVHMGLRPFVCRFSGCEQRFPYKHVRDNHEKSSVHNYAEGDFLASDEQFRSKPRGGRKRKSDPVGSLLRKRIAVDPKEAGLFEDVATRLSRLLD